MMKPKGAFQNVSTQVQFPILEEHILDFWEKNLIFEKSLKQESTDQKKKIFNFYDGPPFATGLPHYGHLLQSILKDIFPRYFTMQGYKVPRRFGWDCHGLPVEQEINKLHGLKTRQDVLTRGIQWYNQECRLGVTKYTQQWEKTIRRVGRFVDMKNAYFTMDKNFMQSVWWVFSELWKKGLIYEGYKVVPYSTGLSTGLSNFEASLNYQKVQDPAITVSFRLKDKDFEDACMLAWTTTPWTLPSNLALGIHRNISYSIVKTQSKRKWVCATELIQSVFEGISDKIISVETIPTEFLIGKYYEPIFGYFKNIPNAFQVIHADHVQLKENFGTGIVHLAPAFGEEDYYACLAHKMSIVNPVDDDGCFTAEVGDFAGKYVKSADKEIIQFLKTQGSIFKQATIEHNYPYCWRTNTPLIYKAVSSWFVAVEKIKDKMISNNQQVYWIPSSMKEGRFGHWLENARDWCISRNRFWGTPIPIWRNDEGEVICIESKLHLEQLTGLVIEDLHSDFIDTITIPSSNGKDPLKRVPGVLDCWFESGSMPYAQWGYPYANQDNFLDVFPADFISEGQDQTRGWFYTLMVLSTALFEKPAFLNVIVNGLILAEDGKKMSKSLKNYPDPHFILNSYGADALRLYLIDSPVVKAQDLRFSESGIREIVRKILIRWWNAYCFFINYANIDGFVPSQEIPHSTNILDQWILSRLSRLVLLTKEQMEKYQIFNVVPPLLGFIEELTNTYIRFNRKHFWQEGMPEDKIQAYEVFYYVLITFAKVMAPFTPFLSESMYQNLSQVTPNRKESVHLETYPDAFKDFLNPSLEQAVEIMNAIVLLGRNFRDTAHIKAKVPLNNITIIHRDQSVLDAVRLFQSYFQEELNFKHVAYDLHEDKYIHILAKANFARLGKRIGPKMKVIAEKIAKFSLEQILALESGQKVICEDEELTVEDVEIKRVVRSGFKNIFSHPLVSIMVDDTVSQEQLEEGLMREIIRKIQNARKNAQLNLDDRIDLQLVIPNSWQSLVHRFSMQIQKDTLAKNLEIVKNLTSQHQEQLELDENQIYIGISKAL